jgi:hypothetical protein
MSLKTMTVSKLKDLKRQVEAAIHAKVTERRQEIESELSKLSRLDGGRGAKAVRAGTRGMVALKVGKKLNATAKYSEPLPIVSLPVEPVPIEPPPVASIHPNVMPTEVSAAA